MFRYVKSDMFFLKLQCMQVNFSRGAVKSRRNASGDGLFDSMLLNFDNVGEGLKFNPLTIIFTPQPFCPDTVTDSRGDFYLGWKINFLLFQPAGNLNINKNKK